MEGTSLNHNHTPQLSSAFESVANLLLSGQPSVSSVLELFEDGVLITFEAVPTFGKFHLFSILFNFYQMASVFSFKFW